MSSNDDISDTDPFFTDSDEEYIPVKYIKSKFGKKREHNLKNSKKLEYSSDSNSSAENNELILNQPSTSGLCQQARRQAQQKKNRSVHNLQTIENFVRSTNSEVSSSNDASEANELETSKLPPQIGKKRKNRVKLWQRNIRKAARTSGSTYKNPKGTVVPAKEMGANCNCKKRCFENVGEECCRRIFSDFYSISNKDLQDSYLYGLIKRCDVSRQRPRSGEGKTKASTYSYKVPARNTPTILMFFFIKYPIFLFLSGSCTW